MAAHVYLSLRGAQQRGALHLTRSARFVASLSLYLLSSALWMGASLAQLNMGISAGEDQVPHSRLRSALWLGAGASGGSLSFRSNEVSVKAKVAALPAIYLGGELWSSESYGLSFVSELGLGAQLELPALVSNQELSYNHNHSLISGHYRWHLGERALAPALELGLGLRWQTESVAVQRPTIFTDRLALGPALSLGFQLPFTEQLSSAVSAAYSQHLIFREDPADSGTPADSSVLSFRAQFNLMFSAIFGLTIQGHYRLDQVDFDGFGTRISGVRDGASERGIWGASLGLRVAIR